MGKKLRFSHYPKEKLSEPQRGKWVGPGAVRAGNMGRNAKRGRRDIMRGKERKGVRWYRSLGSTVGDDRSAEAGQLLEQDLPKRLRGDVVG